VLESKDKRLSVELATEYVKGMIGPDAVCLRSYKLVSYNDKKVESAQDELKFVGPTLKVKPGDMLKIQIVNRLDDNDCNQKAGTTRAAPSPNKFNITNLHTHGLEVSPAGNSDNVYVGIKPGKSFQYEFAIPDDHPPGTFWYHPHYHESTAMQVSSGMAGTLIVEGTDDKSLDQVLGKLNIKDKYDKVFVFQQIPYRCKGENDISEGDSGVPDISGDSSVPSVKCQPQDLHLVQDFFASFDPGQWTGLGRHSTINGQLLPVITMQPGEVQRWRFIHAGVQETLNLSLCKDGNCQDENNKLKMREIAVDGLAVGKTHYEKAEDEIQLEPGYRSDVLVKAPEAPGLYELVDRPVGANESVLVIKEPRDVIALVEIKNETPSSNGTMTQLPTELPNPNDLIAQFGHIPAEDINGTRLLSFNLDCSQTGCEFQVDGKEYDHNEPPVALNVGTTEQWTLLSLRFSHPFHIHVNPFEVITTTEDGEEKGVWRDTIMVTEDHPVTIRTRYNNYIGKTVLHCHILDHEDLGMMKAVEFRN
jgi:FtsP/CotA-like multicopper oxidase with cupredoxin domain